MSGSPVSESISGIASRASAFFEFFADYGELIQQAGPDRADLVAGNPQEPALAGYGEAIRNHSESTDPAWFAYTMNAPEAQAAAAASLNELLGSDYRPEDILMTNAAMAGLAVSLRAVCDPGDEVVIISPPHFLYEPIIMGTGAVAVRVRMREDDFDLDVDAIAAAVTERTRAVIVNSPHNPTGRIYPPSTLASLADALTAASQRNGRTIYLLSDEAYNRIVFDGNEFRSPAQFYPPSFLVYTYGKTLLTPGQRIGYVALRPDAPNREDLVRAITVSQLVNGWMWPNALLQHAVPELEGLTVDVPHLQERRDRMVAALRDAGYELHVPEAAFYLLVRSPIEDDEKFVRLLAEHEVFTMPGSLLESPGYFRISLTASDAMIDRALPVLARMFREVGSS
jgi:aspartate aminotransferase